MAGGAMGFGQMFGNISQGGDTAASAGSQSSGDYGKPLGAPIGSALAAIHRREQERKEEEARRLARNESAYEFGRGQDAYDTQLGLAGSLTGNLSTDYQPAELMMNTDRSQIGGGAMETLLNLSGGYNPAVAADPAMGIFAADRNAMARLEHDAKAGTEQTLSDWESVMAGLAQQYDTERQRGSDERDRIRGEFNAAVEEDKAGREEDMARLIVDQWISSNSAEGASGAMGDFRDRRGRNDSRGKVLGAREGAKRDHVNQLLQDGYSYEQILESMAGYFSRDPNVSGLYGEYVSEHAAQPTPEERGTSLRGGSLANDWTRF